MLKTTNSKASGVGTLGIVSALLFATLLFFTVPTYAVGDGSPTTSHTVKINIYDSTDLTTIVESCERIKADQAQNHTYTEESYNALLEKCEAGQETLDCLAQANDTSECANPDDKKDDIEDAIEGLEVVQPDPDSCTINPSAQGCQNPDPDPDCTANPHAQGCSNPNPDPNNGGGNTTPTPTGKPLPPNTGTWTIKLFNITYQLPILPFIMLSFATLLTIGLVIYLIQRRIKEKGIGGVRIKNPWNKDSYEMVYEGKLVKKHESDPLTEIIDVSQIVRKYRIKFVLWHSIPAVAIIFAFLGLVLVTAPTKAWPPFPSTGSAITIQPINDVVINIDKKNEDPAIDMAKTTTITTNVAYASTWGYTMTVRLIANQTTTDAVGAGITAEMNTKNLTTTMIDIYFNDDSTSPDIQGHEFVIAVPFNIELGVYQLTLQYNVSDNPIFQPSPLSCSAGGKDWGWVDAMQYTTSSTFASWNVGDYGTVGDIRNSQEYVVCKMPDNHVWMLNNLKLGSTTSTTPLTPANTNITSNWTLPQLVVSGSAY
ncbi:hypothetical protein FWF64_00005, partial [Candidatus Saccharibacteria bacterium]|nr:hypothetical protein [Candidatus Saccharibacteria bacterium]